MTDHFHGLRCDVTPSGFGRDADVTDTFALPAAEQEAACAATVRLVRERALAQAIGVARRAEARLERYAHAEAPRTLETEHRRALAVVLDAAEALLGGDAGETSSFVR